MSKSSILSYQTSIKNSIKSSWTLLWITLLLVVPISLYTILLLFENEIAGVVQSFVPPTSAQGFAFYTDLVYLVRTEILWLGFFSLLAFLLTVYPAAAALDNFFIIRSRNKAVFYMMMIAFVFFLTVLVISGNILERFPNSSDEYAYLFQAEMFSRGKLWERAHDLPDFFYSNNITQFEGILVSRFPPGWPLLLSMAFEIGLEPALMNPVLGLVTLVVFYFFARRYYGEQVAVWAMLTVAFTGYFIFNSASFFSHTSCLLATLLFIYSIRSYIDTNNLVFGLLTGFFIGCIVTIRYYTAVLVFVPFLVSLIAQQKLRVIRLLLLMGLGGLPCLAYLMWYNYSITGNALTPVTVWAYPMEQLGFVRGHSVVKGLEHWARWILMFFYWSSPGLLILYLVYLWRKITTPAERFSSPEDYTFIALMAGYFFYYQIGGNQYGPRFLFEAFPFLVLLVFSKVFQRREKWATALLLASMVYAIVKFPFITYREERIVDERQDMYDLVEEQHITNAVVIVGASTSPIRPMPADDLTRNDGRFLNDVIYALEIPKINDQLMEYYGDRAFYQYVRDVDHPDGELLRIR